MKRYIRSSSDTDSSELEQLKLKINDVNNQILQDAQKAFKTIDNDYRFDIAKELYNLGYRQVEYGFQLTEDTDGTYYGRKSVNPMRGTYGRTLKHIVAPDDIVVLFPGYKNKRVGRNVFNFYGFEYSVYRPKANLGSGWIES